MGAEEDEEEDEAKCRNKATPIIYIYPGRGCIEPKGEKPKEETEKKALKAVKSYHEHVVGLCCE